MYKITILIILSLFFSGCPLPERPVCIYENKQCKPSGIFTERWYDYYEWAISFKDCKCYDKALDDFKTALELKPTEKRWIKTIGVNYISYFPHREKGIIHYYRNELDLAEQLLSKSIMLEPTAKARFFLDLVRKAKIEKQSKLISSPNIRLISPEIKALNSPDKYQIITNSEKINITGIATDKQYISEIIINNKPLYFISKQHIKWEHTFDLNEGIHDIPITAKTLSGGIKTIWLKINIDRSGPSINLHSWETGKYVKGVVYDLNGINSLTINKKEFPVIHGDNKCPFYFEFNQNEEQIRIISRDIAGNETAFDFDKSIVTGEQKRFLLAQNKSEYTNDTAPLLSLKKRNNNNKPVKIVLFDLKKEVIVFKKNIIICGAVIGNNELNSLTIKTKKQISDTWKVIYNNKIEKGRLFVFNQSVDFDLENNLVCIKADDINGNSFEIPMTITRRVPEEKKVKHRNTMIVNPFKGKNISGAFNDLFSNIFLKKLIEIKRFQIVADPSGVNENFIAYSKNADPARFSCKGKIFNSYDGVEISLEIIDNVTSEKIYAEIFDKLSKQKYNYIDLKVNELIQALINFFPLEEAVLKPYNGNYYISKFTNKNISTNSDLIAFTYKNKDELRGSDTIIIGKGYIDEKFADGTCIIKLIPPISGKASRVILK